MTKGILSSVVVNNGGKPVQATAAAAAAAAAPDTTKKVELERNLSVWNGVSMILGVMIGGGIFVSPQGVIKETGSIGGSLVVWLSSGLLSLLGALCFAELGTSISSSGGEYTYFKLAYGPLLSFLYLWVLLLIILPCGNAIAALTFSNYILQPFYIGRQPPDDLVQLLAFGAMVILTIVNCVSVRSAIKIQNSFTMTKVISLILIITCGLYYIVAGKAERLYTMESVWSGTETSVAHFAKAFYGSFFTYFGWTALNRVTEEVKDPVKNIPRAITISMIGITFIYTMTNMAYFAVLSKEEMLASQAIVGTFGDKVLTFAKWLMPLLVAISALGALHGNIFATSRIIFAGARSGQLFSALSMIHADFLTPIPAILFLSSTTCIYLFTTTIIMELINYIAFVEASFAILGVSTMLVIRCKLPDLERPLRIHWLIAVVYLVLSTTIILLPIYASPAQALIGITILLVGIPVYYLTVGWEKKPLCYERAIDKFNFIIQKITKTVPPTNDAGLFI